MVANDAHSTKWSRGGRGNRGGAAGGCGAGYGFGMIGALVYYIQESDGFWSGLLGVLKALFWPAFVVYHLLKHLGA